MFSLNVKYNIKNYPYTKQEGNLSKNSDICVKELIEYYNIAKSRFYQNKYDRFILIV